MGMMKACREQRIEVRDDHSSKAAKDAAASVGMGQKIAQPPMFKGLPPCEGESLD